MRATVTLAFLMMLSTAPQSWAQALGKGIRCVSFSPDGTLVAATFGEPMQQGRVVLWNVASQKQLWTHLEKDGVPSAVFAPDGKTMAIGGYDHKARLLETRTGQVLKTFEGHTNYVRTIAIAPDNKTLATGSWDGTVKIWDLASGDVLRTLPGPGDLVYTICFSPGGKWLMASDPELRIWEAATGKEKIIGDAKIISPAWAVFVDDNSFIAVCQTGSIRLWNIESGEQRVLCKRYGRRLAYSPKTRKLAVCGGQPVELYDYPSRTPTPMEQDRINALLVRFDDDSYETREAATKDMLAMGMLAEPDLRRAMKESPSAEVRIRSRRLRDVVLTKPPTVLPGTSGDLETVAFSPDGQSLAFGGKEGAVLMWNLADLKEIARLTPVTP